MSQTGRNDSGMDPFGPNRNEFLVQPLPYDKWPAGKVKRDLVDELSQRLNTHIPGASFNITQPIIDTSTEIATGSSADLAVIISGPDLSVLRRLAAETLEIVKKVDGAADTSIEQEADQPQLRLDVDRGELARYGLNITDVQDVIELALGGRAVGAVFEGERRFDLTVRYIADARADRAAIARILVASPSGARVPLGQLVHIETVRGPSIIARRENERQITVRTNIRERDQGGFVADAQAKVAAGVKLPAGYRVSWGGQFENLARARARLSLILPITILIVFALLFVAFASVRDAALVLVNVPFSLVGGILALYLRGIHLSVSAAVGFITLFGVAVMGGLLYVAEINRRLERAGHVTRGCGRCRRDLSNPADVHADHRRHAGDDAGGACHRHRLRHPAAAGDGDRRRAAVDAVADPARPAQPLLRRRAPESISRRSIRNDHQSHCRADHRAARQGAHDDFRRARRMGRRSARRGAGARPRIPRRRGGDGTVRRDGIRRPSRRASKGIDRPTARQAGHVAGHRERVEAPVGAADSEADGRGRHLRDVRCRGHSV